MPLINIAQYPERYQPFALKVDTLLTELEERSHTRWFEFPGDIRNVAVWFCNDQLPKLRQVNASTTLGELLEGSALFIRDLGMFEGYLEQSIQDLLEVLPVSYSELADILVNKNINYGSSFDLLVDEYGLPGMLIRFEDKANRLKELLKGQEDLVGESVVDTLMDIAGYATLSMIYLENNKH